jgi:uracil-DNA glycosylase family 4
VTEKPLACSGCPAYERGLGFVPATHPARLNAVELAVVGQGPGEQEATTSRPFHEGAPAGSVLTRWLHGNGIPRSQIWLGNTVQCWMPKTKKGGRWFGSVDPTPTQQAFCWRAHVGPSLLSLPKLKFVVPVGTPARHFFMGKSAGERYCGTFTKGELPEIGEANAGKST